MPKDLLATEGTDLLEGTAPEQNKYARLAQVAAGGANQTIANTLGLPVDIVNNVLSLAGLGTEQPVGGSAFFSKLMPETPQPQTTGETFAKALGEQAPLAPITGPAIPIAAGLSSGAARTFAPDSPVIDMFAQLVAGLGPQAIKGIVKVLPSSLERSLMERAMKPSTVLKETDRVKRLETALREGTATTKKGLAKSKQLIKDINSEIQDKIDQYTLQGIELERNKVIQPVEAMKTTEMPKQAFPKKPTEQIQAVIDDFTDAHPEKFSLREGQNWKQSINKELDEFYSALKHTPDKTPAIVNKWTNKAKARVADGLRNEISEILPELKGMNQREASLIELNKSLERAVSRISQRELTSLKSWIALVGNPKLAFVNYILDNPKVQSNLAIAVRRARESGLNVPGIMAETGKQIPSVMQDKKGEVKTLNDVLQQYHAMP